MAITVTWNEYNGTAATATAITNLAFGARDTANLTPSDHPIVAGQNSFVKYVKAVFAGITTETLSDFTIHLSGGTLKDGESLTFGSTATYARPTQAKTSDPMIDVSADTQNVSIGGSMSGTIVADGATDYLRFQRCLESSVTHGRLDDLTITLTYTVA
jgi:hypothetical protein